MGRLWSSTVISCFWLSVIDFEPTGFKEVKLIHFEITGISPLECESIGDSALKGCRSDPFEVLADRCV